MRRHPIPRGTTLPELLLVLSILAVLAGVAVPPFTRSRDAWLARSARDALAAGVARARAVGVARGGSRLVVEVRTARWWIEADSGRAVTPVFDLAAEYGVELSAEGATSARIDLRFDAMGLGRMSGRTFRLRRGAAEANLTVAAYGRTRRW